MTRKIVALATLVIVCGFLTARAFMQDQKGVEEKRVEQGREETVRQSRPVLGPGVALTYPDADVVEEQTNEADKVVNPNEVLVADPRNSERQFAPPPQIPQGGVSCNGAGGNWSAAGSWTPSIPTAGDTVTINSGCTIIIDTAAVALNVTVASGGTLQFDNATGTLTAGQVVTVNSGGVFQSDPAGTVATHTLNVGTDLTNNGTLDFSTNGNAAGADISFFGAGSNSFSGSGGTTDIRSLIINKGTSSANTLEVKTANFTVQGTNTDGAPMAFLTLTNGTLKMSGAFSLTGRVFNAAAYVIPATAGFWLNNANMTVAGQSGNPTNNGVLRVSAGTFNMGTVGANVMGAGAGASFTIEGGIMNVAGRITSANAVTYTQSAGTVNVCAAGGCTTTPSFGFTSTLPTNVMNMSGGAINMVQSNTLTTADYNQQGTINFTGGTVQFGTGATATNFNFRMQGNAPNVVIDNTTNNKTLLLGSTGYVYGTFNIQAGTTFNPNASILNMLGSTFTNNGTITGCLSTSATSRLQFSGAVAQSYTGAGTVCTAADPMFGFAVINRGSGVTIDPAVSNINVARLLAFSGSLINAAKVNLSQVGTNVMVIQRGGVAQLPVGSIDVAPSFSGGTSFLILVYSQGSTAATTGVEIPATRTALSLQEFNTNGVTIAGGSLALTGTGGASPNTTALFLGGTTAGTAGGPLYTSAVNLITLTSTATASLAGGSEIAYVNGPLARTLPSSLVSGSTYTFPVGKSMYKGFDLVNPTTNAGGTVVVQAEAFDANSGGTAGAGLDAINNNRYWNATMTSGGANFINSTVRVTELNSTGNALGQSATQGGAYAAVGGTLAAATIVSTAVTSLDYFAVGRVTATTTFPGGTYTIGTAGNYASLTAAMADLTGKIITGPITYTLQSTYSSAGETFPIVVPRNGGSNATNTITIKPDVGVTTSISGSSANAIIRINDAYVTIDGSNTNGGTTRDLTIQNTNVAANTAGIWVASSGTSAGATNVTLKNMNVRAGFTGAGSTTAIWGIFAGGTGVNTAGNNNAFLKIQNNAIDTAFFGISARAAAVLDGIYNNLVIQNNVIGNANAANIVANRGIELIGANAPIVRQNEIFNMQSTAVTSHISGIELGSTVYYATVSRNLIHDIVNNESVGSGAYGMEISTSTNEFSNTFVNNSISNIYGRGFSTTAFSFDPAGIRITGGAGHKLYFNSVNMFGAMVTASWSAAFVADSTTDSGMDLRNNIFVNAMTGPAGSKAYAGFVTTVTAFGTSANLGFGTINYNDYYSTGTASVANFLNFYGVDHTSLTAWRSSTQNDVNSLSADPLFVAPTNLELTTPTSPMIGAGQTIAGITIDILGRGRLSPPAIGAYEPNGGPTAAPSFVSGQILRADGRPLDGVSIDLSGTSQGHTFTDINGLYRFDNLPTGGFYTIVPGAKNYTFTPASLSFTLLGNRTNASFTATDAAQASVAGRITKTDGTPLGGATINLSGGSTTRSITNANGEYRFDNVPTGALYSLTPALANYSFSPSSRSFSLVGNRTDDSFTALSDQTATGNAINSVDYFVRQQYLDFLGREPDMAGWLYWTDRLNACGADAACMMQRRIDVSAAFFNSVEFRETGSFIYRLYREGLGRQLSYGEFSADRPQVLAGADLEQNRVTFANQFVGRPEFISRYGKAVTAESFVDRLIETANTATGVDLTGQRDALIATYNQGADRDKSRSAVLRQLADNQAVLNAENNPSFVLFEYFGYLQRNVDTDGYQFWLNVLNQGAADNYRGMVCSFLTSDEYQRRFSPVVVHSNAECAGQ